MHDIFFLAVGVILTGIGLLMITAKVLTYIRFTRQNAGKKKGAIHYEKTILSLFVTLAMVIGLYVPMTIKAALNEI